jgi:hypothetical protein
MHLFARVKRKEFPTSSRHSARNARLSYADLTRLKRCRWRSIRCLSVLLDAGGEVEFAAWGEEAGFDGVGGEFAHLFEREGELLLVEDVLVEQVEAGSDAEFCGYCGGVHTAAQHSEDAVDGILHAVSALVGDVNAFRREVTNLITVVSLCDCYVNLVSTHVASDGMR